MFVPALVVLVIAVTYGSTTSSLIADWTGAGSYSHGFLALAISAWLIYRDREFLKPGTFQVKTISILLIAALSIVWLIGNLGSVLVVQQAAVALLINFVFIAIYGLKTYGRILLIPIGSILLIVPIWSFLATTLQHVATNVVHFSVSALSIPIYREGFVLSLPGGKFVVEEGCSGLGFFLTSVLLSAYFSSINNLTSRAAVSFLVFAVGLSVLANWLRILIIVLVGNYTQMENPIVDSHLTFGWILFSIALIPLFIFGSRLATVTAPAPSIQSGTPLDVPTVLLPLATVLLGPVIALILTTNQQISENKLQPPVLLSGYKSSVNSQSWSPNYEGYDSTYQRQYYIDDKKYEVVVINYEVQRQGKELIYFKNRLFDLPWVKVDSSAFGKATKLTIRNSSHKRRLIYYWYEVAGQSTSSQNVAKLLQVYGIFIGDTRASLVAIATQENPEGQQVDSDADAQFLDDLTQAMKVNGGDRRPM